MKTILFSLFFLFLSVVMVPTAHAQPCWWNGYGWVCPRGPEWRHHEWRGRDWQWHDRDWRRHRREWREDRDWRDRRW